MYKIYIYTLICCSVWGVMNIVFFNIILGLMALSHVRAMTCDPGMVSTLHNNHPDFSLIQTDKYKQQVRELHSVDV